jgi:hypothetical protein
MLQKEPPQPAGTNAIELKNTTKTMASVVL